MRAGNLRHRVQIQARREDQDDSGQPVVGWTVIAPVWANIAPLSGRELLAAQAVHAEITHQLQIRWQRQFSNPIVMASYRIVYGDRIFNIHASVDPDERRRDLVISCSEGLNDG